MPIDLSKYPKDWKVIAKRIKDKALWRCQQCGKPCRIPGETWEGFRVRLALVGNEKWLKEFDEKHGRFTLTTAHLNHNPQDCRDSNLRAMCSVCHLRYDKEIHVINRRKNNG